MAATRLITLHINKGKSVAQCLAARTDYSQNTAKTNDGEYISSYACDPMTADEEFLISKREYQHITGRARENDVIAYQIRQSFKPGEISPEEANQIGQELALTFTKKKHAFIVATHIDKAHIHNHIIFNSTTIDSTHKFNNFFFSAIALRRASDMLCLQHGLSVINPKPYNQRTKRTEYKHRETIRDEIYRDIDKVLLKKPKTWEMFLKTMTDIGYDIKAGKHTSVKGKNQKRYIRFKSLKNGYREEDLKERLSDSTKGKKQPSKANLLLDIQSIITSGKGAGYERWAKVFNLKQAAKTLIMLQENHVESLDQLSAHVKDIADHRDTVLAKIRADEERLTEISDLKKHIINYMKTREVYTQYRKSGYSKRFFEDHRNEIQLHKAAKDAFNKQNLKKLPTIKPLQDEYAAVLEEKKSLYKEYKPLKESIKEWQIIKANVERMLDTEQSQNAQNEREATAQKR